MLIINDENANDQKKLLMMRDEIVKFNDNDVAPFKWQRW